VDYSKRRAATQAEPSEDLEHSLTSFHVVGDYPLSPHQPKRRSSGGSTAGGSRSSVGGASSSSILQAALEARRLSGATSPPVDTTSSFGLPPKSPVSAKSSMSQSSKRQKARLARAVRRASAPPLFSKSDSDLDVDISSFTTVVVESSPPGTDQMENEMIEVQLTLAPQLPQEEETPPVQEREQKSPIPIFEDMEEEDHHVFEDKEEEEDNGSNRPTRNKARHSFGSSALDEQRRRKMMWLANQVRQKNLFASLHITSNNSAATADKDQDGLVGAGGRANPPPHMVKIIYPRRRSATAMDAHPLDNLLQNDDNDCSSAGSLFPLANSTSHPVTSSSSSSASFLNEMETLKEEDAFGSTDDNVNNTNAILDKSWSLRTLSGATTTNENCRPRQQAVVMTKSVRRSSSSFVAGSQIRTYNKKQ